MAEGYRHPQGTSHTGDFTVAFSHGHPLVYNEYIKDILQAYPRFIMLRKIIIFVLLLLSLKMINNTYNKWHNKN